MIVEELIEDGEPIPETPENEVQKDDRKAS